MKYYQDITLLPDTEDDLYFLWEKTYQQIHIALVEIKDAHNRVGVGVSFPKYCFSGEIKNLGNKLRLLSASKDLLMELNVEKWLSRLADYVHITRIREVPAEFEVVMFSRKVVKSNEKLAKERSKHLGVPYGDALASLKEGGRSGRCNLPFIQMTSHSTANAKSFEEKNRFPLFIEKQNVNKMVGGNFDSYGLSRLATVPWF